MRRTTLMSLTLVLGAALVLPGLAFARGGVVSNAYENLDWKIDNAYADGWLTRWEVDDLRAMQNHADRVIDRAFYDGRITNREQIKIDAETGAAVATFRLYRDNQSMRYARPVVIVHPVHPKPRPVVVVHHTHHKSHKVVHHGSSHKRGHKSGHKKGHKSGSKSHRR